MKLVFHVYWKIKIYNLFHMPPWWDVGTPVTNGSIGIQRHNLCKPSQKYYLYGYSELEWTVFHYKAKKTNTG